MTLIRSTLQYAFSTIVLRLLPFILIPLYTRNLTIDDYGRLATLLSVIQILLILMDCGARTSLITYFRPNATQSERAEVFGSAVAINFVAAVAVSAVGFAVLPHLLSHFIHERASLLYVVLCCLIAYLQALNAVLVSYYRITSAPRKFALATISTAVMNLLLVFIIVVDLKHGIIGILTATSVSFGITSAVILVTLIWEIGFHVSISRLKRFLAFGAPLILSNAGEILADTFPIFFLAAGGALNTAGVYSIAMKVSTIPMTLLVLPFVLAYEPYVVQNAKSRTIRTEIPHVLSAALLLFAFLAFAVAVAGTQVIAFMAPPAYRFARTLLFFLLPAIAFRALYYGCEPLLHVKRKSLLKGVSVLLCVVTVGCLYHFVVPRWGGAGAAVVYGVTIASYAVFLAVASFRLWGINTSFSRFAIAGLMLVSLLAFAYILPEHPLLARYSYAVIIGFAAIYVVRRAGFVTDHEYTSLNAAAKRLRSALPGWAN